MAGAADDSCTVSACTFKNGLQFYAKEIYKSSQEPIFPACVTATFGRIRAHGVHIDYFFNSVNIGWAIRAQCLFVIPKEAYNSTQNRSLNIQKRPIFLQAHDVKIDLFILFLVL